MTDPRNFLLNTDHPLDKIVYMTSGSFTVSSSTSKEVTITHSLGFIPLVFGVWSLDSSFSNPQEFDMLSSDLYAADFPYVTWLESDVNSVYITFQNNSGANKTMYYRIYAFEPSNSQSIINHTSNIVDFSSYIINTDLKYLKLYMSGIKIVTSPTEYVYHNLGYRPAVMLWEYNNFTHSNSITPINQPVLYVDSAYSTGFPFTPYVDTEKINFPTAGTFHYRIYLDDYS